jgi:multidrug efflux pump subunit AcrB
LRLAPRDHLPRGAVPLLCRLELRALRAAPVPALLDGGLGGHHATPQHLAAACSLLGLLALLGVSVETAVILVSYINKLRLEGKSIRDATYEASLLRLRPIMMTALVACLGLLPAALSTGVGSDTQKPFAIVIVAGLLSRLFLGFFVNPVLYEVVAREGDVLQV